MVHTKTRWKWHECLEARKEILSNDSDCETDDYIKDPLLTTHHQAGPNAPHEHATNFNEDIFTKFKVDTKNAFVHGATMARTQVDIERQALEKKRKSLYDFIGIHANVNQPLSIRILEEMNLGQLQVIVNDLHCQIEVNNNELINLLLERDSLSMEQDSILVDIEDLTKRLQERADDQSKSAKEYVYLLKRPEEPSSRRQSIFQKFFSKKFVWK